MVCCWVQLYLLYEMWVKLWLYCTINVKYVDLLVNSSFIFFDDMAILTECIYIYIFLLTSFPDLFLSDGRYVTLNSIIKFKS